ncbi:MAG: hypothetical protein ACK4LQ_02210 [Pararhodobacter sp.]
MTLWLLFIDHGAQGQEYLALCYTEAVCKGLAQLVHGATGALPQCMPVHSGRPA